MIAHSLCDAWPDCDAVGGHAASIDGKTWHYSGGAAYTTTVAFTNGDNVTFSRRERPELMLGAVGLPTHLVTEVVDKTEEEGTMSQRSDSASEEGGRRQPLGRVLPLWLPWEQV